MKIMTMILSLFAAQAATASEVQFNDVVRCKVESLEGRIASYVPIMVGDEIVLDASQTQIRNLDFTGTSMIPVLKPLQKKFHQDTHSYVVYFQAEQYENTHEKGSLTVMIGKFRNEMGNTAHSAIIQSVIHENHTGLTSVAEVNLSCHLVL